MRTKVSTITVVTVVLNGSDTVRLTLESVKNQKNIHIEHLIIDGVSTDNTLEIVKEYSSVRLLSEKDKGVYYAMDKGAKLAKGDVLIFLNAGDVFYDEMVCRNVANFFNENLVDICFGNLLPVYQDPSACHDHPSFIPGKILRSDFIRSRHDLWGQSIHHQATFYRRWIFDRSSYIALDKCANGEYNLLLASAIWFHAKIKYIDLIISRFALGGISTSSFQDEWLRYTKARSFLRSLYFRGVKPDKHNRHSFNFVDDEFHETESP